MSQTDNGFSLSKLTVFAREFAGVLFREFPDWLAHAECMSSDPGDHEPYDGYDVTVRVKLPSLIESEWLVIQTDSLLGYVVVSLGPGNAELADWHRRGSDQLFREAIGLIKDVLCGKLAGVRLATGGCGMVTPESLIGREDVQQVVSWTGGDR